MVNEVLSLGVLHPSRPRDGNVGVFRVKQAAPQITETFEPSRIKLFLDVTPKEDTPERGSGDKVAIKIDDNAKVAIKSKR